MINLNKISKTAVLVLLCLGLSACFIRPYKFDLQQGNVIDNDQLAQVAPGMTEEQVQFLLGTPMLQDVFHTHRWDYVYYEKLSKGKESRRHVAIYFDHGRVSSVTKDPLPEALA
jgi:outer membrane protein assembly factor BamE